MKSSRVFIKSNYIKKAKDEWVLCDANILTHDKLSILRLTSVNVDKKVNETDSIKKFKSIVNGFKVLLNLSEFKSCEIKPINFRNSEKFAIKLVPFGILHNKKLLIVPDEEDELAKLCGSLKEHLNKSRETDAKSGFCPEEMSNGTIKLNGNQKKVLLNTVNNNNNNSTSETCEKLPEEIYFSMDDNDVYDGNSMENSYTVCIEDSVDSKKLLLKGSFILRLKEEGLELADIKRGEIIHKFPYIFIRRFGAKNDILRLEAGRKCTTGEGYLMFRFKDAQKAVETIREFVKELKKSSSISQVDCSTLDNSRRDSLDLSINSTTLDRSNSISPLRTSGSNNSPYINSNSIVRTNSRITPKKENEKSTFFTQEISNIKSQPPPVSPKPQTGVVSPITPNGSNRQSNHPLYNSINSAHSDRVSLAKSNMSVSPARYNISASPTKSNLSVSPQYATINRPPVVNNNFNRNNHIAASFSCSKRPTPINIPVIKDDSYCKKNNGTNLYDNIPIYEKQNDKNKSAAQSTNSSVRYSSAYSMQGPLIHRQEDNYDNVPNNQRCIRELETMLNDLGIPSH